MRKYISYPMAAMLAMTTTLGAVKTSTAGAFPVDTVTSTTAVPQDVIEAHWNGGGAFFAGAALGFLGAAIASSYYYGPHYYSYYYPSYAYAPYYGHYGYWGHRHHYGYWGHRHYRHYGY